MGNQTEWATTIARTLAWLLVAAITALSIVPPGSRPVTSAPNFLEHFAVFLVTGMALCLGYRDRKAVVSAFLLMFAGCIEFVQLWIPGRHSRLSDLLINSAGVLVGIVAIALVSKIRMPGNFRHAATLSLSEVSNRRPTEAP